MTVIIFSFIGSWNAFLWPLLVTTTPNWRPLMVGLYTFVSEAGPETQLLMAGAVITLIPILILYFFTQKQFTEGYELLPELRVISDEWLTHRASTEKRFSIGWFDESYLQDSPVILVRDSEGQAVAFANLAPEYQCNEISIDLMRYHPSAEKGVMDLLFVGLIEWAHQQGYTTFSLGLSALSGIGESSHDPGVERALHYVYEHVTEFYNFKGLHHFKDKYHPRWAPRYLVYPGPASLLAVTSAMVRLNGGEGAIESYLRRNRAGQPH